MQFPESWLRTFCNPALSTQALADTLTMAGLEVEDLSPVAPPFTRVVVAQIEIVQPHPNADRLRVCQVNVGEASLRQIVCGAPNAREGLRVPCALVGAELPPGEDGKPFVIKLGKLRGVESQGMLCSASELGLHAELDGLLELAADAPVGMDLRAHLQLDDTLFTLKLTPNLAHCLSVYGIAREVSALTGAPLKPLESSPVEVTHQDRQLVRVQAPDLCARFSGRVVRGVNTRVATPQWMLDRLARCGQRPVSPLVDISNYVMFELGQPTHIFDLDKIQGALEVRWGRAGETLALLNGNTVTVDDQVGVIADEQALESLAGIMGGQATAVSEATSNIYIEAAFWWPQAIAGRSRRYKFSTDAGHRFERGVDAAQTVARIERISALIQSICGGEAGPIDDWQGDLPPRPPVSLRLSRAAKVIGMPLTLEQCEGALQRLGLPVARVDHDTLQVTPPSYRFDLQIEADLIEEVARIVGFDALPTRPPVAPVTAKLAPENQRSAFAVRRVLAGLGYQETINYSFVEERWETEWAGNANPIRLLNPIASQMSVMRSSLMGSLLQVLKFNTDRKADRVRIFEIGRVFLRDAQVPDSDSTVKGFDQPMRVAGLAFGATQALQWGATERPSDFYDVKGDLESLLAPLRPRFERGEHPALHPGRSARLVLDGRAMGWVGELHPRWRQALGLQLAPVLFELELDAALQKPVPAFAAVPKHQSVQRDLAVIVGESVTHAELMAAVGAAPVNGVLREAVLFDVFKPQQAVAGMQAGERSLAIRLSLNDAQAPMTDAQIDQVVQSVLQQLQNAVQARLRA